LDLCRKVAHITSDASVSMMVAKSMDMLHDPRAKEWDDYYPKDKRQQAAEVQEEQKG